MKQILINIGNFLGNIVSMESDISSKRVCLIGFLIVVTVMWVIMSFVQRQLVAIDTGVVAIIIGLAASATGDHFVPPQNGGKKDDDT